MSNVVPGSIFAGLNGASAEERNPKLPENSQSLLDITMMKMISNPARGSNTLVVEHKMLETDSPKGLIGGVYSSTFQVGGQYPMLSLGRIKAFLAAVFNVDPNSAQDWEGILAQCLTNGAAAGRKVRAQVGAWKTHSSSGVAYKQPVVEAIFRPA